jgi:hypothetical protein
MNDVIGIRMKRFADRRDSFVIDENARLMVLNGGGTAANYRRIRDLVYDCQPIASLITSH